MGKGFNIGKVVYGDNIEVVFFQGPSEENSSDTPESIDCYAIVTHNMPVKLLAKREFLCRNFNKNKFSITFALSFTKTARSSRG